MIRLAYDTDLTNDQWEILKPLSCRAAWWNGRVGKPQRDSIRFLRRETRRSRSVFSGT
jgi:hypothetical protein